MAVSVVSFAEVTSWFSGASPKTITGVSWSAGDVIVVVGGRENATGTISTPTNANLTFSLQASVTTGGSAECPAYEWAAVAGSAQINQTISVTGTTGTNWGVAVWVLAGGSGSFANASANQTESGFTFTPTADSAVVYYFADFSANATDQTQATGTGTKTERVDNTDSATYANYAGEWVGVTASSTTFGVTSYAGLQVAHVVLEILAATSAVVDSSAYSAPRLPGRIGPDGRVFLPGPPTDSGGIAAPIAVDVDVAILVLSGVDLTLDGTGAASVTSDVANLVLSGVDPVLAGSGATSVTVDTAVLTFSGVDPTLSSGATNVTVDTAVLTLVGVTPTLAGSGSATTTVDVGTLVFSGVDVTVTAGANITVDTAVIVLSGVQATLAGTGVAPITADPGVIVLLGVETTLGGSSPVLIAVAPAVLVFSGVDVSAFSGQLITPDSRIYVVPAYPRTYTIDADARIHAIPADTRTLTVPSP